VDDEIVRVGWLLDKRMTNWLTTRLDVVEARKLITDRGKEVQYIEITPLPQGVMLVRGMTNVGLTVEYKKETK
jgi:hypothetical protein